VFCCKFSDGLTVNVHAPAFQVATFLTSVYKRVVNYLYKKRVLTVVLKPHQHHVFAHFQFLSVFSLPSQITHNLTFESRVFLFLLLQEFGIYYLSVSVNFSHFLLADASSKDILLSVSLSPLSAAQNICVRS